MRYLIALLALLPVPGPADEPLTLDDVGRLTRVTEVSVSPSGTHIAFVREIQRDPFADEDGEAWAELHVLKPGEEAPRRYVRGEVKVEDLAWSADAKGIFFRAKRGEDEFTRLWVIPVDGGEAFAACSLGSDIDGYALNPDGSRIALLARPAKPAASKTREERGFKVQVIEEDVPNRQLMLGRLGESEGCAAQPLDIAGNVARARFSPDGERLLLAVAPDPGVDAGYMQTRLRIANLEGGIEQSIDNRGKLGKALWSPDGRRVVYLGVDDLNDPLEGRLMVADSANGEIRDLWPGLEAHVVDLTWLDDDRVAALVHQGVDSELVSVDVVSGRRSVLNDEWGRVIRSVSASDDGRRLTAIADAPGHPPELFDLGGRTRRLTDGNPWLADRRLARQETLHYAARDGLELEGLLIYPLDYQEGRRYPLIVYVHGGPESHRSDGWLTTYSAPVQVAAAEGYFGFVPNYRGSTGRGVAFSKLHQHDYAGGEFDDIVDGKNALVDRGLVDPKRVGITGGSYGGYATAWSSTALSEHYAAGVMFVGISDQISKFGTTDIPEEMYLVHSRAWPWDDWLWMLERSPIYHARKSSTPLLIMHGDADPRVHPSQSLEMYRYLKLRGQAPVRLVYYPGEKHGNRRAAARYDYSRRLMRWMNHYLQGPGGEPPQWEIDYSDRLGAFDDPR